MYSLKREKGKRAMNLTYQSTRGGESGLTASQAILKGLADDGGLFMPTSIPKLDVTMEELAGMTYQETAYRVMKQFLTDFTEEELRYCIDHAYDSKFDMRRSLRLSRRTALIIWSCSTEVPSPSRTWHCPFFRI